MRKIRCSMCGTPVVVWFTNCDDHFHFFTVCICPFSGLDDGMMVDPTKLNEWGRPIGYHT